MTVENRSSDIAFDSMLRVEEAKGGSFEFPVDNFLRLTVPEPSDITLENIDEFLMSVLD